MYVSVDRRKKQKAKRTKERNGASRTTGIGWGEEMRVLKRDNVSENNMRYDNKLTLTLSE